MKIIDFSRKGNLIRFYLGEYDEEWGWVNKEYKDGSGNRPRWLKPVHTYEGDNWDKLPYEIYAGRVYDEYIKGYKDIIVPFDDLVIEPCQAIDQYKWTKEELRDRMVPCIIIVKKEYIDDDLEYVMPNFALALEDTRTTKYYFGDELEVEN